MYNKQLETFLQVAEKKSFSKAAEALYVSPSAVIQQMNNLEKDLQVTLFIRTKRGVALTEAGEYLKEAAPLYIKNGNAIRTQLQARASAGTVICVGTSLTLKVRLLYDLWMLFSNRHKDYTVKLVNMDAGQTPSREIMLIEGLYPDLENREDVKFLKICDVPFACAVPKDHPLASRKRLRYADIPPYTMMVMKYGSENHRQALIKHMRSHGIRTLESESYSSSTIWECACGQHVLLVPMCWQDILFDSVVIPCEWELTIPYGFWYREPPTKPVRELLEFIHEIYFGENPLGVVPFF